MTAVLCVDIGNTYTVLGLVRDGEVLKDWRLATDERRTADEWGALLGGLLRESSDGPQVEGVCVCATVPAVLVDIVLHGGGGFANRKRLSRTYR